MYYLDTPFYSVMGLVVGLEGTRGQLRSSFQELNPLLQALLIRGSLPCNTMGVGVHWNSARGVAGLTHHAYHLTEIHL